MKKIWQWLEDRLIPDWKQAWRYRSTQFLALIFLMPDVFNALATYGVLDHLPTPAVATIKVLAAAGLFGRVYRQNRGQKGA